MLSLPLHNGSSSCQLQSGADKQGATDARAARQLPWTTPRLALHASGIHQSETRVDNKAAVPTCVSVGAAVAVRVLHHQLDLGEAVPAQVKPELPPRSYDKQRCTWLRQRCPARDGRRSRALPPPPPDRRPPCRQTAPPPPHHACRAPQRPSSSGCVRACLAPQQQQRQRPRTPLRPRAPGPDAGRAHTSPRNRPSPAADSSAEQHPAQTSPRQTVSNQLRLH